MSHVIRVSEELLARLHKFREPGEPIGAAVERLLNTVDILTHRDRIGKPPEKP